jgi:hypothetical protein
VAGEDRESHALPISGILGTILLAATIAIQQAGLDSPRPSAPEPGRIPNRTWLQAVDARLWQDPMSAIAHYRERERIAAKQRIDLARSLGYTPPSITPSPALSPEILLPPDDAHEITEIVRTPTEQTVCEEQQQVRVLAVMVQGGASEEDAELRRRSRYAVVSGLMNADFQPDNSEAIGYAYVPSGLRGEYVHELVPETIPFEWFGRSEDRAPGRKQEWILVLWLDQGVYYTEPLSRLRKLMATLFPTCDAAGHEQPTTQKVPLDTTVLGPVDTDAFAAIVDDIDKEQADDADHWIRLKIVSATATGKIKSARSQFHFRSKATTLVRLIGTDDRLTNALIQELNLRKRHFAFTNESPVVVVLSEKDTEYGRLFAEQIKATSMSGSAPVDYKVFHYLRQIDGGGAATTRPSGKKGEAAAQQGEAPRSDAAEGAGARYSRSHGTHHVDYLRRLVEDIGRYREEGGGPAAEKRITAVAIFGNDVYDKLLILRALKPAFPDALFLTTDLDARLLDPGEAKWARNLVVATNYGFTLGRDMQFGATPFREGYQTATYLASLLIAADCAVHAIEDNQFSAPWIREPLLFEIGRTAAIPLVATDPARVNLSACKANWQAARLRTVAIQPAISPPGPAVGVISLASLLSAILLMLVMLIRKKRQIDIARDMESPEIRGRRTRARIVATLSFAVSLHAAYALFDPEWFAERIELAMVLGLLSAVFLCTGLEALRRGIHNGDWLLAAGGPVLLAPTGVVLLSGAVPIFVANVEPFAWVQGVSVWPTQMLRLLSAGVAIYALWYMAVQGYVNTATLTGRYGLHQQGDTADRPYLADLWRTYARYRIWRILATILSAMGYFFVCVAVMIVLDARPGIPVRGQENLVLLQAVLAFVIFISIVLLAAVVTSYATFIVGVMCPLRQAGRDRTLFPLDRVNQVRAELGLVADAGDNRRFIELSLAVQLMVDRTDLLMRFIYFPFAVFALLLIARSPLIDTWDTPLGLGIILALPFVIVIACVVWLRMETVMFHNKVIADMGEELIKVRGAAGSDRHVSQLERMLERVRHENRGSFQNLALQPMIRALLLPIVGFSGIEVLEHMLLRQ